MGPILVDMCSMLYGPETWYTHFVESENAIPYLGGKFVSKAEANRYEPEAKEKRTRTFEEIMIMRS